MLLEALIHRLQTVGYDSAAPLGSAAHTGVGCLANTAASAGIFPFDLAHVSNGRYTLGIGACKATYRSRILNLCQINPCHPIRFVYTAATVGPHWRNAVMVARGRSRRRLADYGVSH